MDRVELTPPEEPFQNGFWKMTVNYWIRSSLHIYKWHAYFSVARVKPVKCLFSHLFSRTDDEYDISLKA